MNSRKGGSTGGLDVIARRPNTDCDACGAPKAMKAIYGKIAA